MKKFSTFALLSYLLSLAAAAPQLNPNSCYGCVIESECKNRGGDLHFSFNTYYLLDRWMSTFGSRGGMNSQWAYAVCDQDWCIVLENTAGAYNEYSQETAQAAIDSLKGGEADGCSNYIKKFSPDNFWLGMNVFSSWYTSCSNKPVTEVYGETYDAALPCG
ncbi:hypothetical protein QM012_005621 [Aureobasidium pullulans]|uniref:Uncharacterized protein n=1 Tax=Aureobasidium pullulans TaxID=5580 RepID=A0ABR0T4D6_AURPU